MAPLRVLLSTQLLSAALGKFGATASETLKDEKVSVPSPPVQASAPVVGEWVEFVGGGRFQGPAIPERERCRERTRERERERESEPGCSWPCSSLLDRGTSGRCVCMIEE